jgi:putative transposase
VPGERGRRLRFLVRDRDSKFCHAFDDVFRSEAAKVLLTPVQAPNANAYAERWIGTVRRRVPGLAADYGTKALGAGAPGLHRVQRPSPALVAPVGTASSSDGPNALRDAQQGEVRRHNRLGGLLHEYRRAA